jgi:hypothetical protein
MVNAMGRVVLVLAVVQGATACKPEFAERSSAVTGVRVLAVQSEPAEAQPRPAAPMMNYTALVVDAAGPRDDVALDWAFCTMPKPVSELNDVSRACLAREGAWLAPLNGTGASAAGPLPANGCRQFGPDPPDLGDGGLGRPADPDSTGGYYQPVRVLSASGGELQAVGQTRLRCNLAGGTADLQRDYSFRYRNNTNPAIDQLILADKGDVLTPDAPGVAPLVVSPGATLHLHVAWVTCDPNVPCPPGATDQCPEPDPCTGAESYLLLDLTTRQLVLARESIRVSWFATAGSFTNDDTGRAAEEYPLVFTENDWTAPTASADVYLWAVIRDSRGGVSWNAYRIQVE